MFGDETIVFSFRRTAFCVKFAAALDFTGRIPDT
jgi:hypothetical protein